MSDYVPFCMKCGSRHWNACSELVPLPQDLQEPGWIRPEFTVCPGCLEKQDRIDELVAKDADKREKRRDYQRNYMRSYRK